MITAIARAIFWLPDKLRAWGVWAIGGALALALAFLLGRRSERKDASLRAAQGRIRHMKGSQEDAREIEMLDSDALRRRLQQRLRDGK